MSEQSTGALDSIFGPEPGLLTILVVVWLVVSGAFERIIAEIFAPSVPARPPSIRLGVPCLVPMSDGEAADAAHLLGSSVAALVATDWDN